MKRVNGGSGVQRVGGELLEGGYSRHGPKKRWRQTLTKEGQRQDRLLSFASAVGWAEQENP